MRVAIGFDSADSPAPAGAPTVRDRHDLRSDPQALDRIESAQNRPLLRGFLASVNASDSLFSTIACKTWTAREQDATDPCVFASRIDLVFLREDTNFGRGPHEDLAQRLAALIERESGDALRVELRISPAIFAGEGRGYCLKVFLYATGATPEQAEVRWGLGLARMQQALLFVARALRQHPDAADGPDLDAAKPAILL